MMIDIAGKVLARTRLARWMTCPSCWAEECLKAELVTYQRETLDRVAAKRKVALRGPHGLGKSFIGATLVHWFATTREMAGREWKVNTTASKGDVCWFRIM